MPLQLRQIPVKLRQWLLIISILSVLPTFLSGQDTPTIDFANHTITIDGDKNDWEELSIKINNAIDLKYRNDNAAQLCWDKENLYAIFEIKDKNLCVNEKGENSPRLYFNDGVEIYIDTKNDSKSKMDKNDYQFLLSISNEKTVFKGDKYLINEGYVVPKDNENTNIIIMATSKHIGTINAVNDVDSAFIMEVAIPWSAIGLKPYENMYLKLDLCVNDIDTFTDIRAMPDTIHPKSINFINLNGKTEYGYPDDWTTFKLTGKPNMVYKLTNLKMGEALPLLLLIAVVLLILIYVVYRQYKRISFYKSFPTKATQDEIKPQSPTLSDTKEAQVLKINPVIEQLNTYIQDNIENNITIEDMARSCTMGIRQLQRLTKSELNLTPIQHLTIMKLEKACEDLKNSKATISEIAYKYNFSDPSYFSAVFKKYFGLSPAEWRKREMKD